jgi:hypothetical protein
MGGVEGLEGLDGDGLERELEAGGRFVVYTYTISIVVVTFRQSSAVRFVRGGESRVAKGLPFTFASLLLGWWGIPWGPIYTIASLGSNLSGGKDVTDDVLAAMRGSPEAKAGRARRQAVLAKRRDAG